MRPFLYTKDYSQLKNHEAGEIVVPQERVSVIQYKIFSHENIQKNNIMQAEKIVFMYLEMVQFCWKLKAQSQVDTSSTKTTSFLNISTNWSQSIQTWELMEATFFQTTTVFIILEITSFEKKLFVMFLYFIGNQGSIGHSNTSLSTCNCTNN